MVVLLASVLVYCTAAVLQSLSQAGEGQNLLGGGGALERLDKVQRRMGKAIARQLQGARDRLIANAQFLGAGFASILTFLLLESHRNHQGCW